MQYYQIQLIAWLSISTKILNMSSLIFEYHKLFGVENILFKIILIKAKCNEIIICNNNSTLIITPLVHVVYKHFNLIIKAFVYYERLYNN